MNYKVPTATSGKQLLVEQPASSSTINSNETRYGIHETPAESRA